MTEPEISASLGKFPGGELNILPQKFEIRLLTA